MLAIAQGSHQAFEVLVRRHTARFYRLAYYTLYDRVEAEDRVQEAFVKLWSRPERWNPHKGAKFTTWFYRVVLHACLDAKRKKRPLPLDSLEASDGHSVHGPWLAPEARVDVRLDEAERRTWVAAAIARLPERQRTALNLCFYEKLSNREAAAIMGIRLKALQSLLMRAKATLKAEAQAWLEPSLTP